MSDAKVASGLANLASKIFLKFYFLNGVLQKSSIFCGLIRSMNYVEIFSSCLIACMETLVFARTS